MAVNLPHMNSQLGLKENDIALFYIQAGKPYQIAIFRKV